MDNSLSSTTGMIKNKDIIKKGPLILVFCCFQRDKLQNKCVCRSSLGEALCFGVLNQFTCTCGGGTELNEVKWGLFWAKKGLWMSKMSAKAAFGVKIRSQNC